jgi:hypothetical protein
MRNTVGCCVWSVDLAFLRVAFFITHHWYAVRPPCSPNFTSLCLQG